MLDEEYEGYLVFLLYESVEIVEEAIRSGKLTKDGRIGFWLRRAKSPTSIGPSRAKCCKSSSTPESQGNELSYINNRTLHDRRLSTTRTSAFALMEYGMIQMTAGQVESSTGGILVSGSRTTELTGVSIDTRTLARGDLFFAIPRPA